MTGKAGEPITLSRAADHLGTLANILKDLGGGATLLNELTQNADDSRAAQLKFTATARELVVHNTAVFSDCGDQRAPVCPWKVEGRRACDLHSFRKVAGREKEGDSTVTGAYGVGFTAVYQVTDQPELITGKMHWILDELQPEHARVVVCQGGCRRDHGAAGTTFFLPWVKKSTELRRALGQAALTDQDVDLLIAQMHEAAPAALVFLDHLRRLEVESPGRRPTIVERERQHDFVTVSVNDRPTRWLLLEGEVAGAEQLKARHDREEDRRSPVVQVAVPMDGQTIGRVYASLPTETRTGWSGHINGSFVPKQDRKAVEFRSRGFRGEWNDLLIDTAARIAAENLESIADTLDYKVVWEYLVAAEQINRDIARDEYPAPFSAFFTHAKIAAPAASIALLIDGTATLTAGTLVPRDEVEYDAAELLTRLGLQIIHPSIRRQILQISRSEYGIQQLGAVHVVDALRAAHLVEPWVDSEKAILSTADAESILRLLNHYDDRGKSVLADAGADTIAIVPCLDGSYATASSVARLRGNDRALFELLDPDLKILDEERLNALCPALIALCDDITPERAVEIFEADVDALAVAPDEVLEWLANHRSDVSQPDLRDRVSALPVFPSASGEYRKLTDLSLPSDFEDVLEVADVVHPEKVSGYTDLLRRLGATELDAAEYLTRHVAKAASLGRLGPEKATAVLGLIDRHSAELAGVRGHLGRLRLVLCEDGIVRPAIDVHLPNRALSLIAPEAPIADVGQLGEHLCGTLVWLGVSDHPNDQVLNEAARRLGETDASPNPEVVAAILDALPNPPEDDSVPSTLSQLRSAAWLPCNGGRRGRPAEVYATFQRYLFESQGLQLALPSVDQQRLTKVLEWLGVQSSPTTAMVVAHLRHCADNNHPMNAEVYRALGQAKEEHLVSALRDRDCIQIAPGKFVAPGVVFWTNPGLGSWAHVLPATAREQQTFYDRVGVQESPTPEHIEQTLRAISREAGNDRLGDADKSVVHRCWELLDDGVSSAGAAFDRLGVIKSAVGPRDLLEKPTLLLFADGRRLAEAIPLIRNNLIRRDKTTCRALEAAGVRPAEEVITPHVDQTLAFEPARSLPQTLIERRPALERLAEAQRDEGVTVDLSRLDHIRIDEMPELAVEYVTRFAHQVHVDDPRPAEAIYFAEDHRLIVRSDSPSRHVARELSLCIAPDADTSSLAPSITEVLAAANLVDAMEALDDYGVRDLDSTVWAPIESETVAEPSADDRDETTDVGSETQSSSTSLRNPEALSHDGLPEGGDPLSGTTSDNGPGTGGESKPKARTRQPSGQRRTHMVSFVSYDITPGDDDTGDAAPKRSAIDAAGVATVLAYERSCGREPQEQAHNNPGFDVLSRNNDGDVARRIEIKSIGGAWTGFGVWMSATQMEDNRASGDDYWLYVVEYANDPDAATLHRIQNPAGQATKFGFDAGWQAIREPDLELDEAGKPTTGNTRRLLGWNSGAG